MSAESVLVLAGGMGEDEEAGGEAARSLFDRPRSMRERRSLQPVDRLSRELGDACTAAVDPLEIAAILEAQGISDEVSRELYNCADVFDLAERLWARTPVVEGPVHEIDSDRPGSPRDLLHGIIFALNGLFFSVGLATAADRRAVTTLVIALVAGWAVGQTSALLWYRLEARAGDWAGRMVLRRALQVVLVLGLGGGWLSDHLGLPPSVTLVAVAQVYMVVAASALLLYRKELWFIISLVPAIGAVAASWLAPERVDATHVLAVVVGSIMVIVAEAAWLVRPTGRERRRLPVQWADAGAATQMALYGVTGALLLSHSALSTIVIGVRHDVEGFDISVLPLVLTIGIAEWELRSYRHVSRQMLGLTDDLVRFGRQTWRLLLRSLTRYAAAMVAVSAGLWFATRMSVGAVTTETTLIVAAYVVLGGALFLNLVLIAHDRVDLALRSMIGAATLYALVLVVQGAVRSTPEALAAAYLALCLGLFLSSLAATRAVVRRALVHL